jgi:hypothetical protein
VPKAWISQGYPGAKQDLAEADAVRRKSAFFISLVLVLAIASCGRAPQELPLEVYSLALRPGQELAGLEIALLPRYQLSLVARPQERTLAGRLTVYYRNNAEGELRELYFRLYPNMPAYGGNMRVLRAAVDGREVPFVATGRGVDLKVPLPRLLPPGGAALVTLDFALGYPQLLGQYAFFGESNGVAVLPDFYPMLAALKGGEWHLDSSPGFGEAACTEASLYQVEIALPPGFQAFGLGLPIGEEKREGQEISRFVAGPARNLALVLASGYEVQARDVGGVRLFAAAPEADRSTASAALAHAEAGMAFYEELLGPFPQAQLWLVKVPLVEATVHASGALLLPQGYFTQQRGELGRAVSSLLAWQWWGNKVGTDPLRDPWLAESLGQVCAHLYRRAVEGPGPAEAQAQAWREEFERARSTGLDGPLAQRLPAYGNLLRWQALAGSKGPLFWLALGELVGEQGLRIVLREMQREFAFQIIDTQDVTMLLDQLTGPPGMAIVGKWVLGTE